MNCPHCGTGNSAFETRCTRCGARFSGGPSRPGVNTGVWSERPGAGSRPQVIAQSQGPQAGWGRAQSGPRPFLVNSEASFSSVVTNAVVVPPMATPSADLAAALTSTASTARQLDVAPEQHRSAESNPANAPTVESSPRARLTLAPAAPQQNLFQPGDWSSRPAALRVETQDDSVLAVAPARRKPMRKRAKSDGVPFSQGTLEFLTPTTPPTRQLRTKVDASVRCEQPIASAKLRMAAATVDALYTLVAATVLISVVVVALRKMGVDLPLSNMVRLGGFAAAWGSMAIAYHCLFAFLGADTPGHCKLELRVVSFDGSFPTPVQRWKRLLGSMVSLAAAGAGFLWAIFDEEQLGWQDHISETFSTLRSSLDSSFHRQ